MPFYDINYKQVEKRLDTGFCQMDKTQARPNLVPNPQYDPPYKFYQTIDSMSPKKKYVPKLMEPPTYE